MAKKDPEKVLKDLEDYRVDGDRQRVLDEIDSFMEVESVDDSHATVKHAWLGFAADRKGVDQLTCELATWEMPWDKQAACWVVEDWAPVDTLFRIDFTKDRIPWKKIRGLFCASDEDCAQTIASNSRFEREFLEATAKLPANEDDIYSVIADPLLHRALKPEDDSMAKPRQKLKFRLPEYESPRNAWRKKIHATALKAARKHGAEYGPEVKLAVEVKLYLRGRALEIHDVDNQLKDILDALQGRAGGSKAMRTLQPIILNDRQVYRVVVNKSSPPGQSHGLGHVVVGLLP